VRKNLGAYDRYVIRTYRRRNCRVIRDVASRLKKDAHRAIKSGETKSYEIESASGNRSNLLASLGNTGREKSMAETESRSMIVVWSI